MRKPAACALALATLLPAAALAQQAEDERLRTLFQRQCGACHQLDTPRNGVGPTLQGVMGRVAGTVEGFNYSPAMRDSEIVWTPESMDEFLANPTAMMRGTRMPQRFPNEAQRRDIVEFLAAGQAQENAE